MEDISLCRKELQQRIQEQIILKFIKQKDIKDPKRDKLLLKPGYDYDQDKNVEFDNNRRVHFYHGMQKEEYHKVFDEMYHRRILELDDEKNPKTSEGGEEPHEGHSDHHDAPERETYKRANWTLRQDNKCFKCWNIFKLIVCFITTMIYPYYSVNGFPESWSFEFM